MPSSIARPMVAGINASLTIQTMPSTIPPSTDGHCCRVSQNRKRVGERASGGPGSGTGNARMVGDLEFLALRTGSTFGCGERRRP
jgi:hypothetical protein